ncbi:zinc finger BED domain-containing protein 1 isoform X2 [Nasonia vitripennis]|uniref:BED-type domain-containing protein n=1 Tax=Nasonia vitripennis TaxID=7425 RepID=A0A7M7GBY1_NASVI|nr:zinc finger BED domain-containing protein 1 isoform X2 [Nasonia vitripennis]
MDTEFLVVHKTEMMESEQGMNSSELETGVDIIEQEQDIEEIDHKRNGLQTVFAKFMEEKHSITYRKLVVPQSMRSIYWKFFGFPADDDGEILTRVKIVCLLCKTQIAYNRNTSNLRMHLQNKHVQELHELEALSPPKKQTITPESKERRAQKRMLKAAMASSSQHIYTTNADGTVQIGGDIQFVTDPSVAFPEQCMEEDMTVNINKPLKFVIKDGTIDNVSTTSNQNMTFMLSEDQQQQTSSNNKSVSEAIVEFLIIDLQLPEIVQEQGFQRLIATLKSPCQIPSKNSLEEEIIPTTYNTFRETILSNISSLTSEVSLAVEEWTSNFGESFFSFLIYYQSPGEAVLESKILCTIHGPRDWDELQWGTVLDIIMNEWCIKLEKTTAVIASTTRSQLTNALITRGLTVVPCLLHSLQVCAQTIFENDEVSKVLTNCRSIIGAIASNAEATNAFAVQEQLLGLEENMMIMDYPNVWTSTYTMLQQMIPRREVITMILSSMDGINENVLDLNDEQWQIINDLVEVLEPFKVTIITLSEEKMPLISLLKPLLWQLVSAHLKVKEEDSATARAFKESLSDMLCHHYSDPNVSLLLQIATTLDPRFKEVPYATDEDKKMVATPIKEMLTKLIEENEDSSESQKDCVQVVKKSRISGMELLLGGLRPNKRGMTTEEKANLELAQYQSEATAPLDNCPLQWWAKVSAKCPNLGSIASRYNCVPVCCPPPSRIPADVQMAYNAKRAALPPHLVDKMLFLHANHNLV